MARKAKAERAKREEREGGSKYITGMLATVARKKDVDAMRFDRRAAATEGTNAPPGEGGGIPLSAEVFVTDGYRRKVEERRARVEGGSAGEGGKGKRPAQDEAAAANAEEGGAAYPLAKKSRWGGRTSTAGAVTTPAAAFADEGDSRRQQDRERQENRERDRNQNLKAKAVDEERTKALEVRLQIRAELVGHARERYDERRRVGGPATIEQ